MAPRSWLPVFLLLVAPAVASAQVSAYLPLDDSRLPLIEHLIATGAIADPSPFIRPFRRGDLLRVLADADTTRPGVAEMKRQMEEEFAVLSGESTWGVDLRGGLQAYTHARRDPLHPAGDGGVQPYAEVGLEASAGPVVLVARPVLEPRLLDDPDWKGRKDIEVSFRMADGYISAQWKPARIFYGQMAQNWGPVGITGLALGNESYPRPTFGVDFYFGPFHLAGQASDLNDQTDTLSQVVHRYFFAHRLDLRASKRLQFGLFETTVLSGVDRNFDGRYRNPVSLLLLTNEYGLGDDGNVLAGLDASWQVATAFTFQAELLLDDIQYQNRSGPDSYPDRYAFTVAGFGPLGRALSYRVLYSQVSSLAFRTEDPFNNFVDDGVGIGRNFGGNDQFTVRVGIPVRHSWLVTPELTYFRQGEGNLTDAAPARGPISASYPTLLAGVVEKTFRAAVAASGSWGPLRLSADAGYHHITNLDHQTGVSADRFEGRLFATLGFSRRGSFQ
ncbi:MAG TPA: capsule assembly Wzi family protein [Gemmatimonadales bacterium]|nr:capsule assembly Wzi family protein [Gemmatimonadales bacterium]